ncbi:hypothetical protein ACWD3Z_42565 [Streptomyces sp. NPDC002740]
MTRRTVVVVPSEGVRVLPLAAVGVATAGRAVADCGAMAMATKTKVVTAAAVRRVRLIDVVPFLRADVLFSRW